MTKWIIKEESMGGSLYYMIYCKWLCLEWFYERWNTMESATRRVGEL